MYKIAQTWWSFFTNVDISDIRHRKVQKKLPSLLTDLVGGWVSTHLKNMIVKLDHLPKGSGWNLKRCSSCHHLVMSWGEFLHLKNVQPLNLGTKPWFHQPISSKFRSYHLWPKTTFSVVRFRGQMCLQDLWFCVKVTQFQAVSATKRVGSYHYMGVSENSGTPKSSILIWCSLINHPFWGTPILETPIYVCTEWLTKQSEPPRSETSKTSIDKNL